MFARQFAIDRPWMGSVIRSIAAGLALFCLNGSAGAAVAAYCPFCSAVARTFSEQIDSSDVVVIAQLLEQPHAPDESTLPRATFRTIDILKGSSDLLMDGDEFTAVVVGRNHEIGDQFMLMGNGFDDINWTTPMKTSKRVIEYLTKLDELPETGAQRLEFFAKYFEDEESVLAYDAYDEFARAPYEDVKELREKLDRGKLIGWLKDPDVMKSRKRLYYTLLGVCGGNEEELEFLEDVLKSGDRERQAGLDALIACYLTLKGDQGLPLIEELFLSNPKAEYIDVFSAIQALRFHGTEADKVSSKNIVKALRHVLDRPKMADMVIPDLARWKDWEVMEKLVQMFRDANTDETNWVRTPIINYLQACPKPEAKKYIAELREIDPAAVKRAEMLADLNWDDEEDEDESDNKGEGDGRSEGKGDGQSVDTDESSSDQDDGDRNLNASFSTTYSDDTGETNSPIGLAFTTRQTECLATPVNSTSESGPEPAAVVTTVKKPAVNSVPGIYVSTGSDPAADLTADSDFDSGKLAQSPQASPPLAATGSPVSVLTILVILVSASAFLFLLLWSVLNGWFERLIF